MKYQFLSIRYWPWWFFIGILRVLIELPYPAQLKIGRCLGHFIRCVSRKIRHITAVNLQLCFPDLDEAAHQALLKKNFESVGIGILEAAMAYWASDERLKPLGNIYGVEHLQAALAKGKGVIMIGTHFTTLQVIGRLILLHLPFTVVYRRQKNLFLNQLMLWMVQKFYKNAMERGDIRAMLRGLKQNKVVWYTPDVDAGLRNSVFASFFGVSAASITATARLAKLTGATVIMLGYYRRDDDSGYDIEVSPPFENFPTDDVVFDIQRINQAQEQAIRKKPDQYMWQYKRFKTRPLGEQRFY